MSYIAGRKARRDACFTFALSILQNICSQRMKTIFWFEVGSFPETFAATALLVRHSLRNMENE